MQKVIVWGSGNVAKLMLSQLINTDEFDIVGIIDNNIEKQGKSVYGYKVYSPDLLKQCDFDRIIIMSDFYEEIKKQIIQINEKLESKIENKYFFVKDALLKRYKDCENKEIKSKIRRIEDEGLKVFNYDFVKKYKEDDCDVNFDKDVGLYYANHNGKAMYFSKEIDTKEKAKRYYNSLRMEQDIQSPHRYIDEKVCIDDGAVVVDVGVAEGNFSLDIVDKVKKLYLIEADENWCNALKITFKDYRDKVEIINGYLTSYDDGMLHKLDSIIDEPVDFIKMDIEGAEYDALCGADKVIDNSPNIKLAICSYHGDYDEVLIKSYMQQHDIEYYTSDGYMWFPYTTKQTLVSTKLVKGMIRGYKV